MKRLGLVQNEAVQLRAAVVNGARRDEIEIPECDERFVTFMFNWYTFDIALTKAIAEKSNTLPSLYPPLSPYYDVTRDNDAARLAAAQADVDARTAKPASVDDMLGKGK